MGVVDDNSIKLNGQLLNGIIKSLEMKGSAIIEELEVEGKGKKPIQATGFEDSSINLELILLDDLKGKSKEEKLQNIQDIFKTKNQRVPKIYEIVNKYINQRGIYKVIVKDFSSKITSSKEEIAVTLSLREYEAVTLKVTKNKTQNSSNDTTNTISKKNNIKNKDVISAFENYANEDFEKYLNGNRGTAPTPTSSSYNGINNPLWNSPISSYILKGGKK